MNEPIPRLVDAGMLTQAMVGRRRDAFGDLELQLASRDEDSPHSPPIRHAGRGNARSQRAKSLRLPVAVLVGFGDLVEIGLGERGLVRLRCRLGRRLRLFALALPASALVRFFR